MAITLCGASWYNQKYYLNPAFDRLPEDVRRELQIMSVEFTEDVGGVFTVEFGEDRLPHFSVLSAEGDPRFDEIGAELKIRRLQREKEKLLVQLTLFYRIFILGESAEKAGEGLDVSEILERVREESSVNRVNTEKTAEDRKGAAFDDSPEEKSPDEPYLSPFERLAAADVSFVPLWPDDLEDMEDDK